MNKNGQGAAPPNPYAAQFERMTAPQPPNLDSQAPELKSSDMQRMNRRALGFLAALVLLLGLAAFWMLSNAMRPEKPQKTEEVITVPAAPQLPPPLPHVISPPQPQQAEAIPLAQPPMLTMPAMPAAPSGSNGPSLMERRMAAASGTVAVNEDGGQAAQGQPMGGPGMGLSGGMTAPGMGGDQARTPNGAYRVKALSPVSNAQALVHADVLMLRGTYIRCVLETHIVSDVPGFTSCVVTEPVYSVNGKRLLLPKGSKVLGKYETEPTGPRIAVIWDRIVTPNGIDVNMASPGIDNLGGAGHPGHLDEHWPRRIASAMLISMFADAFKIGAAKNGPASTTVGNAGIVQQTPYESYTAQTLQSLATQAVRRSANMPDTVTINQGTVVNVYVAKDVDFSAVVAGF